MADELKCVTLLPPESDPTDIASRKEGPQQTRLQPPSTQPPSNVATTGTACVLPDWEAPSKDASLRLTGDIYVLNSLSVGTNPLKLDFLSFLLTNNKMDS